MYLSDGKEGSVSKIDQYRKVAEDTNRDLDGLLAKHGLSMPVLPESAFEAWQGWQFLSQFRVSSGFGAGTISFQDVCRYLDMKPAIPRECHFFVAKQIGIIDSSYRKTASEISDSDKKKSRPPTPKKGR